MSAAKKPYESGCKANGVWFVICAECGYEFFSSDVGPMADLCESCKKKKERDE